MGGGGEPEETSKMALVLAARSKALMFTSPAASSPNMFASPLHTLASVPFCWEDEPGKPKHHLLLPPPYTTKCLVLPPRLLLPREFTKMPLPAAGRRGVWGSWRKKGDAGRGNYVFPSCVDNDHREDERGGVNTNVKITRPYRETRLCNLSTHRSLFWANIYKGFKQVVQRKKEKLTRQGF